MRLLKILSLVFILSACNGKNENESHDMKDHEHGGHQDHTIHDKTKKYTCPMHPEIIRNEPGKCPICKMDLVEVKSEESEITENELDLLLRPTNKYVISQVKTITMEEQTLPLTIDVTGKVNYDTREISTISSKVEGRIEKLYVKYLYQPVGKGEKLMDIYSKELLTEQENYIYLLKNDPDNTKLIKTAEDRLMLQGLTPDQIKKIKSDKKAFDYVSVYSPFSGHLHDLSGGTSSDMTSMNQQPQKELLIKEGMYVQKGQAVFNVYNTEKLWALVNVYPEKQAMIAKGQKIDLFVNGEMLKGNLSIDFIEPELRSNQNTITARIYLPNLNNQVKVGSNIKGVIHAGEKKGYFIPETAVVNLGNNRIVFLKNNNLFGAHKVVVGINANNRIEIISGLTKNDSIAENAQLLMDSESFIKSEN